MRPKRAVLLTFAVACTLLVWIGAQPRTGYAITNGLETVRGWMGWSATTVSATNTSATLFATTPIAPSAGFDTAVRITFGKIGDQTFTVPAGVTSVNVKMWGGGGGGVNVNFNTPRGGGGGYTTANLAVTPGENLTVIVGQGGVNNSTFGTYGGGGAGGTSSNLSFLGGSGGGRSAIRRSVTELLTAGGGGGSSPGALQPDIVGGAGGGANGGNGGGVASGSGGTQAAGGAKAATVNINANPQPTDGSQFQGGIGGGLATGATEGGGGGGGGYFGGGGGAPQLHNDGIPNGSGGGGSGFIGGAGVSGATTTTATGATPPNQADAQYEAGIGVGGALNTSGGDGQVIIQWLSLSFAAPNLNVQAGGRPNNAGIGDPAVCLDPSGLVGIAATLTNPNNAPLAATFTATLPTGLTAVAGTCVADINPGGCTIVGNQIQWNGMLAANTTVTIIYRARLGAGVGQVATLCIDNTGTVGGVPAALQYCFTVNCPLTNTRVSDQKAGSVVVFPYYTSTIGGGSDTRMTISNISSAASSVANQAYVHLFFIDGTTCQQADLYLCLTPNASFSFKASEYDPGNTGYVIAVAVDNQGLPVNNNVLIGNAFVNTPTLADNYGAESFWANAFSTGLYTQSGNTATLYFDHVGYDAVPKQFAVEIQSPLDAAGQQVVTAIVERGFDDEYVDWRGAGRDRASLQREGSLRQLQCVVDRHLSGAWDNLNRQPTCAQRSRQSDQERASGIVEVQCWGRSRVIVDATHSDVEGHSHIAQNADGGHDANDPNLCARLLMTGTLTSCV